MAHCCKVWTEVTWHWQMTTTSLHDLTDSWSVILSLQGPERSENISICSTLTRYCFLPTWALLLWLYLHFGHYLPSKFCLPWHLYFPHGYILSFQLINSTDLTELTSHCQIHSPCCGSTPVKSCYYFAQKKKLFLHTSCLNSRKHWWHLRDVTHYDCENITYHSQCTACSVNTCKIRAISDSKVVLNLARYSVYKSLPLWQVAT